MNTFEFKSNFPQRDFMHLVEIVKYLDAILPKDESDHAHNVAVGSSSLNGGDNSFLCVALLHDVVEDGYATFEELQKRINLDDEQMAALDAITRRQGEQYFDYIHRVKQNDIAKIVKLADLQDNINRCAKDLPNRWGLIRRYAKAYGILIDEWKEQSK